ncbi:hypothetical protein [Gordonia iterans]
MADLHIDEQEVWEAVAEATDRAVDAALLAGSNYWFEHARKDTWLMSTAVSEVRTLNADGTVAGELVISTEDHGADREYAHYQEFGTRYIAGMHLSADIERVMAEAVERANNG